MQLNRFVINGWPPLASHLGLLMLGCGLGTLSPQAAGPAAPLPGSIMVRLKPTAQAAAWQEGLRFDAWKPGLNACRLNQAPIVLATLLPAPLIAFDRQDANLAMTMAKHGTRGILLRPVKPDRASPCRGGAKVHYGSS